MRSVSIRDLRANLSKELLDLPFLLTRNGVIVAIVCTQECKCTQSEVKSVHNLKEIVKRDPTPEEIRVHKEVTEEGMRKARMSRNQPIQSDWRDSINAMPKKK